MSNIIFYNLQQTTEPPIFITNQQAKELLNWNTLIPAIEEMFVAISSNHVVQPVRLVKECPSKKECFTVMPVFTEVHKAFGCKVILELQNKGNRWRSFSTLLYTDTETGSLKAVMEGDEITLWRTAAASVVATKNIHRGEKKVLAILGAGSIGRRHAIAMKHFFDFPEVRIWNRSPERAKKLCEELGPWAVHYTSNKECVEGADVIVTATFATSPIVLHSWVKEGAHINAVGMSDNFPSELDEQLYKDGGTAVIVEEMEAAKVEQSTLTAAGVEFAGELGQFIKKDKKINGDTKITVFSSNGIAAEDVIAAKLVYESFVNGRDSRSA